MADKTIVAMLDTPQPKKHVTRYDASDAQQALDSLYVNTAALSKIGDPAKIKVTIEAA